MKRSEMLIRIQEILVEAPENVENAAEYLLKRIEKAGMLAPLRVRYIDQENGNTLCSEENSWEPEDV